MMITIGAVILLLLGITIIDRIRSPFLMSIYLKSGKVISVKITSVTYRPALKWEFKPRAGKQLLSVDMKDIEAMVLRRRFRTLR